MTALFFACCTHVGIRQETLIPTIPGPLPAPRSAQRVNDEPGKVLNLPFCIFILEKSRNFRKTATLHVWVKAMLSLNPFSVGIL